MIALAHVNAAEIKRYLGELNEELRLMNVKGEICLYGRAVISLVYDARPDTKDVDAIFRPSAQIREAADRVAKANHLRPDWLNDAVKGFLVPHKQRILFDFSNLKVFIPEPDLFAGHEGHVGENGLFRRRRHKIAYQPTKNK